MNSEKINMVRKLSLNIIVLLSMIICSLSGQAQSNISITAKTPTCPVPSNASISFYFKNQDAQGNVIYPSPMDSLKFRLLQTKTATFALDTAFPIKTGVLEYVCTVDSLPYEYLQDGLTKDHEYLASIMYTGTGKTIHSEYIYFEKPEYSALTSLIRGVGCNGQPIGEANVTFKKGVPPYTWDWYKVGDVTPMNHELSAVDGLSAGNYYVRVSDSENCTINSDTVELKPEPMEMTAQVDQNITCKGDATGAISFSPTKNAGDYTTRINTVLESGLNLTSKSSLAAGSYDILLTDTLGCTANKTVTVTEPAKSISLKEDSRMNILCRDIPTGSVAYSPLDAIGNVTYVWTDAPAITAPSRTKLAADVVYTVEATDDAGCHTTKSVTLTQPASKVNIVVVDEEQPSCFGVADGTITVSATGGTGTVYSYFWNSSLGSEKMAGLAAGEYTIVAIDENGCSDTVVYTLNQPESMKPHLTINGDEVDNFSLSCNGETATVVVSATGGLGQKTVDWGDGVFGLVSQKELPAGAYAIKIRDSKDCEEGLSASIVEPELLVLSIAEESIIHCNGDKGLLRADVTGGTGVYVYDWSNGSSIKTSGLVDEGTYSVTITDAKGCTVSDSHTLTEPDVLSMRIKLDAQTCINATLGGLESEVLGGTTPYTYAWYKKTDGAYELTASTPTIANLEQKATYKLVLTDKNGCSEADSVDMTKISSYQVNPKQDLPISCPVTIDNKSTDPNTYDGKLLVNIVGGYVPFYVKISSGGDVKDFTNIYEGDDTLAYWNSNLTSNGTRPTDGIARVRIDSLPIGSYTIEVSDFRGCMKTKTISMTHTKEMSITQMSVLPSACTKPTGSATIAVNGGKAFSNLGIKYYEYEWDNGGDTAVVSGLTIGKHFVKVSDANGCIKRDTVEIVEKTALHITAIPIESVIHCVGGEHGSAKASVYYEGDLAPHTYSFVWSDGVYDPAVGEVTNLPKGTHTVTVTDDDGCTQSDDVTITEADLLEVTSVKSQNLVCYGDNSGQIDIEVIEGGVQPYSIKWNTGETTTMLNDIPAGTYTATVSEASGCTTTSTVVITQPAKVVVTEIDKEGVVCPIVCDGFAEVIANGGSGSFLYTWDEVESTATQNSNLCYGDHFVSAVDSKGCLSDTITIAIVGRTDKLRVTSATIQQPVCGEPTPTGSINVAVAGSIDGTTYNYSWALNGVALPQTTNVLTNLSVGVYSLHLSDGSCSFDTTFSLSNEMTATSSVIYQSSGCNGDTYEVAISNAATAGYTSYKWHNEVGTLVSSDIVASDLKTGTYTISAVDNTGCTFSGSHKIDQKVLTATATATNTICFGSKDGTLSATVAGNFAGSVTYTWYDIDNKVISGGQVYSTAGIGSYYVTAFDANHTACPIKSNVVKVEQPKQIKTANSVVTPSYCKLKNGEMKIDIANGVSPFTYTWKTSEDVTVRTNAAENDQFDICGGLWTDEVFTVEVVDVNGCKVSTALEVPDVSNFSLTGMQHETVHCPGDATASLEVVNINGYSSFTYKWSHNSTVATPVAEGLSAGNYNVTVTDSKGCAVKYTFNAVPDAVLLTVDVLETPEIMCNGGVGNLSAKAVGTTAPFTYTWYSNSDVQLSTMQEFSGASAGQYKVVAADKYGCKSNPTPYTFEEPTMMEAEFTVQVTGCGDAEATGSIVLDTIYGGLDDSEYYFRWTNEASVGEWEPYIGGKDWFLNELTAGTYICTITNATDFLSCNISEMLYTNPLVAKSIATAKTQAQCSYYTDQEYQENKASGSIEITNLIVSQGDYTVDTEVSPADYTYVWSDAKNQTGVTAKNLQAGMYEVTVTGSNGCSKTFDAGEIGSLVNLDIEIYSAGDSILNRKEICLEDSLELKTSTRSSFAAGYTPLDPVPNTYEWKTIEKNKTALISTPYAESTWVNPETIAYVDSAQVSVVYGFDGCVSRPAYYTVAHYDSVGFALEVLDSLGGYVGQDSVTVLKDMTYLINPVQEPWFINKSDNEDGVVSIVWRSYKSDLIEKGIMPDKVTNEATYANTGYYGLYMPFEESNYFTAVATTTRGCRERALVYINVYLDEFIPSGFSPNGDGINDTWIIPKMANCPNAKVIVFNRWGVKVFENKLNYAQFPWNGDSMNGNALPMGTYYYVVEFNDENNTPKAVGSVSILR